MSEAEPAGEDADGGTKRWPPDLAEVRDLDAIRKEIRSFEVVNHVKLSPDHRERTERILVRIGGVAPSTTSLADVYREFDLRPAWASIHPTGDLRVAIEAKEEVTADDA